MFLRPFHSAYLVHKVVCPDAQCLEKGLFFEESGLPQHFRVIHKTELTQQDVQNSVLTMQRRHGEETLEYIHYDSENRSEVSAYFANFARVCFGAVINIINMHVL